MQVTAELWLRLAHKAPQMALDFVQGWRASQYRLLRRLALFAGAHPIVAPQAAADILIETPSAELFLCGSSVEVCRLIRGRWNEFPLKKRQTILRRLREGPAQVAFRDAAEVDSVIDRCRFDILGAMERDALDIGKKGVMLLRRIRARRPEWQMRPPEQAGFHIWSSGASYLGGDEGKFAGIPDEQLVAKAKELALTADFLNRDDWRALCDRHPDRVLRGLDVAAATGDWAPELWSQLLWGPGQISRRRDRTSDCRVIDQFAKGNLREYQRCSIVMARGARARASRTIALATMGTVGEIVINRGRGAFKSRHVEQGFRLNSWPTCRGGDGKAAAPK